MQHEATRRIIERLDLEIRRRKRGALAAVARHLGRDRSWWHSKTDRGDILLSDLLETLSYLRLAPLRFLRRALYGESNLELDFERPTAEPPELVRRVLERSYLEDSGGTLDEGCLKILDTIRYEKPHDALKQAESVANHVDVALLPRFLGVLASIYRHLIRLDDAEHAIFAGIEAAEHREQPRMRAELMQRLAYVVADQGELGTALLTSEKAMAAFLRCGDDVGMARTMVDQGVWLNGLGRTEEAIQAAEVALRHLPEAETVNRFTACQLIANQHRVLGDFDQALEYVEKAREVESTNVALARDKLRWLTANIQADRGRLEEAEALMQEVFDRLCAYRNGEDALIICDLVSVQLRRGKKAEAYRTAKTMVKLLEPLRNDKIVSGIIAQLLRDGKEGLQPALVETARGRIEDELRATINVQRS